MIKYIGTVGYGNTPNTSATSTMLAAHDWEKDGKKYLIYNFIEYPKDSSY